MTLGDYYRENGESEHLLRVEGALGPAWIPTRLVAETADVSPQFAYKALPYLFEEGRVEHRKVRVGRGPVRNEWRLPA